MIPRSAHLVLPRLRTSEARPAQALGRWAVALAVVVVSGFEFRPACRAQEVTAANLIEKIKEAEARARKSYRHYKIAARVTERDRDDPTATSYNYVLWVDGDRRKAVLDAEGKDEPTRVMVASPGASFVVERPKDDGASLLSFSSFQDGNGYEEMSRSIRKRTPFGYGPYEYLGLPLREVLSWKTTKLRSVERVASGDRDVVRVSFRRYKEKPNQEGDFMDCFVDLDPALDLAVIHSENTEFKGSSNLFTQKFGASYELRNNVPVLKVGHFALENPSGPLSETQVEVLSTDFGPIPPREFSLAAAGVTEASQEAPNEP